MAKCKALTGSVTKGLIRRVDITETLRTVSK